MQDKVTNLPKVRGIYKLNEPLSRYTWLNVGGPADVMFLPEDIEDLQNFLQQKNPEQPLFVLGGGSNLLVRDGGIAGVVIKLANENFAKWRIEDNILYCGAGRQNFTLKKIVEENGLGGLEFLCSIPGTIGGAVRGNAGCFGSAISDVVRSVHMIDKTGKIFEVNHSDLGLSYRHSNFPEDWIVLEAGLHFEPSDTATVSAKIAQNAEYRRTHQPQGIKTAGSTFKNPPDTAAWKLIKESGGNGFIFGGARLSEQHCNFLDNQGTKAADVEKLCMAVQEAVRKKCGVELELEIKTIGRE